MFERLQYRLIGSVLAWDILLTMLTLHLASKIRLRLDWGYDLTGSQIHLPWQLFAAVALIWIIVFLLLTPQRALFLSSMLEAVGRLVAAVALASLAFAGLLYLSFRDVSRLQFLYFTIFNLVTLLLFHLSVLAIVRWRQRNGWRRRVLIVGGGMFAEPLVREFERRSWAGMRIVGIVANHEQHVAGIPWLGDLTDTMRIVRDWRIDEVIFTLPPQQQDQIVQVSLELQQQPVMLHMVPGVLDLAFARTPVDSVGGIPLISLRESALTGSQRVFKRIFDICASLVLLLVLSPLMLVIALLIHTSSSGPIFFQQERIGEGGRRFKMVKFRTMYQDAEKRWQEIARRDMGGNLLHKFDQDPRITPIGRKLRRTSLDELPQLFNVLRGEMSLVGPRPEMPYIAAEYQPWQWQRFRVPPGITGWWQVNGRSEKPMHLHTEDDLYYIQNYSFWLDLQILLRTVRVVFNGRGAY